MIAPTDLAFEALPNKTMNILRGNKTAIRRKLLNINLLLLKKKTHCAIQKYVPYLKVKCNGFESLILLSYSIKRHK